MDEDGAKPVKREKRSPDETDDSVFKKPRLPERFQNPSPKKTPRASRKSVPQKVGEDEFMNLLKAITTNTLTKKDFKVTSVAPAYRNNVAMDVDSDEEDYNDKKPTININHYNSEDEDVYSDGEIDEELNAEVARLTLQMEQKRIAEETRRTLQMELKRIAECTEEELKNIPGPSDLGPCPTDDTPMETSPPPSPANLEEHLAEQKKKEELAGESGSTEKKEKINMTFKEFFQFSLYYIQQEIERRKNDTHMTFYFIHSPTYFARVGDEPLIYMIHNSRCNLKYTFPNGEVYTFVHDKTGYLEKKYGLRRIVRFEPRNKRTHAPIIQEVYMFNQFKTGKHELAEQYPEDFDYSMIEYSEDPFWTNRDAAVDVPERVLKPWLPNDFFTRPPTEEMPPFDWNWVPPPLDDPTLPPSLPPVIRMFEKIRKQHFKRLEAEKHMNVKDDVDPDGSL